MTSTMGNLDEREAARAVFPFNKLPRGKCRTHSLTCPVFLYQS